MTVTPEPTRGERNLAAIRKRGTDLAERIVVEKGVGALTARGLAKQLGVSVGTLYNAFGDLDRVVRAVNDRTAERLTEVLHAAVEAAAPDRRSRLIAMAEAYFDFAMDEPERWWTLFEHRPEKPEISEVAPYQTHLLDFLVEVASDGAGPGAQPERYILLWASVHGLVALAYRPTIVTVPPEAARRYLTDLVDAGLVFFRK